MWSVLRCTALLVVLACDAERINPRQPLRKRVLDSAFRSEGVTAFDVDRDGRVDVVTDQLWYRAPDFAPHEIRTPEALDPETQYSRGFALFPADVDADGWTDVIVVGLPGDEVGWYQNPHGERHWMRYPIAAHANVETPIYEDLFGDGRRELVMGVESDLVLAWLEPASDPYAPWIVHSISAPAFSPASTFSHGLGTGDLDGDGIVDVLTSEGWFHGPGNRTGSWTWHPFAFHPNECSQMFVWDVDHDGLADVVSSNPHHYGVYWWQQTKVGFALHTIDDSFSESHAMRLEDLDLDGVPEIVTGKRWYSHGKAEKGALDPPVLVTYARVLDSAAPGGARFVNEVRRYW